MDFPMCFASLLPLRFDSSPHLIGSYWTLGSLAPWRFACPSAWKFPLALEFVPCL